MVDTPICSFCELAPPGELIVNGGGAVAICKDCIAMCAQVFKDIEAERKRTHSYAIKVDEQIDSPIVNVIDVGGNLLGEMPLAEAIGLARDAGLSLVEINPKAVPPVCKITKWPRPRKGAL